MIERGNENIAFPTPNDHTVPCSFCENKWIGFMQDWR